jgi:acetyltransferase-like isoleucine patch superfamily enzyme
MVTTSKSVRMWKLAKVARSSMFVAFLLVSRHVSDAMSPFSLEGLGHASWIAKVSTVHGRLMLSTIENDVIIGDGSFIYQGVTLGARCIIEPGSVVKHNVLP